MELVLKTSVPERVPWVRIPPLPLRIAKSERPQAWRHRREHHCGVAVSQAVNFRMARRFMRNRHSHNRTKPHARTQSMLVTMVLSIVSGPMAIIRR